MGWSWGRKFWGLSSQQGRGGEQRIWAASLSSISVSPPRAEDLSHVTSLPHPVQLHSALGPLFGLLAPRQEEIPGACLIKAFCLLETMKLKELSLLCLPHPPLPPAIPHSMMYLGGPLGPAKALSPPSDTSRPCPQAKHKLWSPCHERGPCGGSCLAGSPTAHPAEQ